MSNKQQPTVCDKEEIELIGKQYLSGMPTTILAAMHYVTTPTVINYLKRMDIPRRKKWTQKWRYDDEGQPEVANL
jgi:hypothetical protein